MAIIDPKGLFGGDRLRRCSNAAQLHFPRLFLASDGFARLEINYLRIMGQAYSTFNPVPSEAEFHSCIQEYAKNYLLFVFKADGQLWGQWDTPAEFLKRYKTAADRRSPTPPEPAFTDWKRRYREEKQAFPKCFENVAETFLYGVGVGVGENTCASPDGNARVGDASSDKPSEGGKGDTPFAGRSKSRGASQGLTAQQEVWFEEWWAIYWRRVAREAARKAFGKHVTTEERFRAVMRATRAQSFEMNEKPERFRPHGSTWLNQKRWEDETTSDPSPRPTPGTAYQKWEPGKDV